jgi:hypothetical protein
MTTRLSDLPDSSLGSSDQCQVLVAEAFGKAVVDALDSEQLGVMLEAPPRLAPATLIERLDETSTYDIGLALVGLDEADIGSLQSSSSETRVRITDELSTAIKWRNQTETEFDWDGNTVPDRIVVFVRGDPPKKGSLHRLRSLPLGEARVEICSFMRERSEFAGIETNLNIRAIAQYAISCLRPDKQASIDELGVQLFDLGLFTDPGLLTDASEIQSRLEENAKLVGQTVHMTNRDRKRLLNSIKKAPDSERDEQAAFIERLRRFQRTNNESLLEELQFERVRSAFKTTSKRVEGSDGGGGDGSTGSGSSSRYSRRSDDDAVGVELSFNGEQDELDTLAESFDETFQKGVDENEQRVEFNYGDDEKLQVDIHSDLTHFLTRFVTEDKYGGIVHGGESRDGVISNFTSMDVEYFRVEEDDGSFAKLRGFADRREEFEPLVESLDALITARRQLIDAVSSFIHSPIIRLLGDSELLEQAESYLEHYRILQDQLDKKYISLHDASAKGARRLLSDFLLLDTIILDTEDGRELILSPLHPLHLWKYVEIASEVTSNADSLTEDDKRFLRDTVEEQPHVLTSLTVGGGRLLQEETYLIQSDEVGTLPVYTEADRAEPGDNKYLWDYLTNKFAAAYPPSKRHLRVTVVDPIKPHQLLNRVATAAENGQLEGATIEFVYLRTDEQRLLAGATSNEEEAIINLFGPEGDTESFNILTRECRNYDELSEHLSEQQEHITVINDQSAFFVEEFERDMDTSINPLYVPKEFDYDEFEDEINISASAEGPLFSEYQTLINQLNNQRPKFHNAGVHELGVEPAQVERLIEDSMWVCISAPSMNSDPFWEENLISRERRGDREYAIYSEDIDLFTRTLRRILNEYPIAPDTADIAAIAERIATTERSGLLRLITEETIGSQQSRNSKGLLGSIIAVQWLEECYEDPKLIFSIDDPRTRRWLNFGDSNRRADFIVLQKGDGGGLEMDIVEVKTLDDPDLAFSIEDKDGEQIVSGDAVDQLAETTNTVRRVFTAEENVTTPPRREALREQLYYELIGRDTSEDKRSWVDRINDVFRGDEQMVVSPRIVSVEIGRQGSSETTQECVTEDRQSLRVTRLPKNTIVRLLMNGRDEFSEPEVEAEGGNTESDEDAEDDEEPDEETHDDADTESDTDLTPETESDAEEDVDGSLPDRPSKFGDPQDYADQVESLKRVLHDFGIEIDGIDPNRVEVGPNLVRFKVDLARGQKQGPLESRAEDIARELALEQEPFIHRLPGTSYVAVDIPRKEPAVVPIENYLDLLPERANLTLGELPFIAGITPSGEAHLARLDEAPHMLVGGTTGSGKTVFLYSLLACLLDRFGTEDLRLAIVDPKMTNFMFCNNLTNLEHGSVITESEAAATLFEWIVEDEIPRRMDSLASSGSVDIGEHNERSDEPLRPLVVMIDEYADLVDGLGDASGEFETNVRRIAQKARSLGIHLVIATQRPSAKIIDTDLRANLDMRVALRLPSASDSQVILDESGAEDLGGNGDLLFREVDSLTRLQGAFVDTDYLRDLIDGL